MIVRVRNDIWAIPPFVFDGKVAAPVRVCCLGLWVEICLDLHTIGPAITHFNTKPELFVLHANPARFVNHFELATELMSASVLCIVGVEFEGEGVVLV